VRVLIRSLQGPLQSSRGRVKRQHYRIKPEGRGSHRHPRDFYFDSSVVSRAPPLRVRAISVPDGSMGVVDLLLHLRSVPTGPARGYLQYGVSAAIRVGGGLCAFCGPPGAAFYDTQVGFCRRTGCPRHATVESSLCAAPPVIKRQKGLVLRFRGPRPSVGDPLARRRQKGPGRHNSKRWGRAPAPSR